MSLKVLSEVPATNRCLEKRLEEWRGPVEKRFKDYLQSKNQMMILYNISYIAGYLSAEFLELFLE
jgi:hypothetical protein